jgi:Fe2+ or Zn2+ uptake regulation protein
MKSRNTKQKELLQDISKDMTGFFTAEDLLASASKQMQHLGIATIYRFLSDACKCGMLHSYTCNRKTVYSNNHDSANHSHYTCEKCGKVVHIDMTKISKNMILNIDQMKKSVPGTICHFQIEVHGVCDRCLNRTIKK